MLPPKPCTRPLIALIVAMSLATGPAQGQSLDCSLLPPLGFPLLGDAAGWGKPEYYSTIRAMDIDGDDIQELMARGPSGLQVYKWDPVGGAWTPKNTLTALSDANKYNDPKYYRTIQFGDVDGDWANELLVRSPDGLHTWKYTAATDSWKEIIPVLAELNDAGCSDPSCYTTIQFTSSQFHRALMVHKSDGLHFYQYTANGWVNHPDLPVITLPSGTDWTLPQYYSTIQWGSVVSGDTPDDVIARASDGLHAWLTNGGNPGWYEAPGSVLTDLSDANLFFLERYYSSIQMVHVIAASNGPSYLVARNINGASLYRFDAATLTWKTAGTIPDLSDLKFGLPQFYRSLKGGRVDGDYDRLFAMAQDALYVWKHNDDDTWSVMTKTPIISQDQGWTLSNSTTVQVVWISDTNNQPKAALLGRSPNNIVTLQYDPSKGMVPALVSGFPAFSGAFLTAYQFISQKLGFTNPDNDIRAHYSSDVDWGIRFSTVQGLKGTTPPSGVTPDQFEAVRSRLEFEISGVADSYNWFKLSLTFIDSIYGDYGTLVDYVNDHLTQDPNSTASVVLNAISLVLNMLGAMSGLNDELGAGGSISSILGGAMTAGSLGPPGSNGLSPAVNKIKDSLIQQKQNAEDGNACASNAFVTNAGLLNALETGIRNKSLDWNSIQVQGLKDAAVRGYKLWLYQTLSPDAWIVIYGCKGGGIVPHGCWPNNYPDKYVFYPPEDPNWAYWLTQRSNPGFGGTAPRSDTMDEIFNAPPAGYGFTMDDVFRNRKGWALPQENGSGIHTGGGDDDVALNAVRKLRDTVLADAPVGVDPQNLIEPLREAIRLLRAGGPGGRQGASHMLEIFVYRTKTHQKQHSGYLLGPKHQSLAHEARSLLVDLSEHSTAAIARGGRTGPR